MYSKVLIMAILLISLILYNCGPQGIRANLDDLESSEKETQENEQNSESESLSNLEVNNLTEEDLLELLEDSGLELGDVVTETETITTLEEVEVEVEYSESYLYDWTITIGGNGTDLASSSIIDSENNLYIAGYYTYNVDFDYGDDEDEHVADLSIAYQELFVTKITAAGEYGWTKTVDGGVYSKVYSMAIDDNDNIFIAGAYAGTINFNPSGIEDSHTSEAELDGFLMKLESDGSYAYTKTFSCSGNLIARSVNVDTSGNAYISGEFEKTADFDFTESTDELSSRGDSKDIFISKINSNGTYAWTTKRGGNYDEVAYSIAINSENDIIAAGMMENEEEDAGDYIFLLKISSDGNFNWMTTYDGTFCNQPDSLSIDSRDNIYLAVVGQMIMKLNSDGDKLIEITLIDGGGMSVAIDNEDNIYITGYFTEEHTFYDGEEEDVHTSLGASDIFITKYNSDLEYLWTESIGSTGIDSPQSISVDANKNLYVVGGFYGTIDFDFTDAEDEITSTNDNLDIFILKASLDDSE
ncbi:MAG: hypothetical protein ABIA04_14000 [Pseudomonadota bacterium]